ncbi:coiled-coil domain-containing protein 115 [Eudromia elegans]
MAALCQELDEAALELLDALETLQRRREAFASCLEQGWLSLSQARYALGCHRVSSLQYGATMVPRVRVTHSLGPGGAPRFEELLAPEGAPPEPPPGPRQRRGAPPRPGAPPEEAPGAPPPKPPPRDPLTWFGILVPRSLRQAQGSFRQGECERPKTARNGPETARNGPEMARNGSQVAQSGQKRPQNDWK